MPGPIDTAVQDPWTLMSLNQDTSPELFGISNPEMYDETRIAGSRFVLQYSHPARWESPGLTYKHRADGAEGYAFGIVYELLPHAHSTSCSNWSMIQLTSRMAYLQVWHITVDVLSYPSGPDASVPVDPTQTYSPGRHQSGS